MFPDVSKIKTLFNVGNDHTEKDYVVPCSDESEITMNTFKVSFHRHPRVLYTVMLFDWIMDSKSVGFIHKKYFNGYKEGWSL